jgi:uncharacterized protein
MRYLLDVNALVALGLQKHEFHERVVRWTQTGFPELATCSISELGFVRIIAQTSQYGFSVSSPRELLLRLKAATLVKFSFLNDDHDISQLPVWVKTARQVTDGHLLRLAKANGAILATLDRGIPGALLIPAH